MPTVVDITGQKFGRLTAIRPVYTERGQRVWLCRCDCGSERTVPAGRLRYRKNVSCGCAKSDAQRLNGAKFVKDLSGKRFGKLLVKSMAGRWEGAAHWLCICDCGQERVARGWSLTGGTIKDCGCVARARNRELAKRNFGLRIQRQTLAPGTSAFRTLIRMYRRSARERGHDFTLSEAESLGLFQSACHYCGLPPSTVLNPERANGGFVYNGIDRIDSERGYIPGNVVPCCKVCNFAKRTRSYAEFVQWIKRAARHLNGQAACAGAVVGQPGLFSGQVGIDGVVQ